MIDLATQYLGLELRNPIIVGASGLTKSLDSVVRCAEAGAGAVVLKSIFEEQIEAEVDALSKKSKPSAWHPEAAEYLDHYGHEDAFESYLELIADAKKRVDVPIIASIHCVTAGAWTDFAQRVEQAGADALELNVFVLPSDSRRNAAANERVYFEVAKAVKSKVGIPVALKIGPYFTALAEFVQKLSFSVDGLVLFNRFVRLDFDIDKRRVVPASLFSHPDEMLLPLRWISIMSGRVDCDLVATTGVHDAKGAIKQLLAGAAAVQVCSILYEHGIEHLQSIVSDLETWMQRQGLPNVAAFRGRMSQTASGNPAAFERVQFIAATAGIE